MNCLKVEEYENLCSAVETSGRMLADRITYSWEEDLWLRRKWRFTEESSRELLMKEICFMVNDEQIELSPNYMEEEPKCKVTFGQGNLQTLSLVLKFQLTDMKVTGTMRTYSPSKPSKINPYELILKDVEFEIIAGLIIRQDSFCIENYAHDYLNFSITLSYKNKDESKEVFPLDKIQDSVIRKSIEKYIVVSLTKDIIIAVEDRVGEECVETSVSSMLHNEYNYRNKLRLHKKRMNAAFQKLAGKIVELVNDKLETERQSEISLPDLQGKLVEKDNHRGSFKAIEGTLKSLSSLQQLGDIIIMREGEDIVLFIFLYFSYLDIVYKHLSMNKKDLEHTRSFETPENSNSSYIKIKISQTVDEKVDLTLLDYKVDDLGYIEVNWDEEERDSFQKSVVPEFAMWLNYVLEYRVGPVIEEKVKKCISEVLKNEELIPLAMRAEDVDDGSDSDPMYESDDEMEEDEKNGENGHDVDDEFEDSNNDQ
ncbi:hypothetical protein QAD02_012483 [Eretmocerus hayati]|uniref:Uncharacterized protein n=1 Tax=Eretmocerus hayati TaxID=131215 RepID=A0ACC2P0V3_9HYME|nr:hypothetical protein QAD02_012483 [Eretmocerus hayati]